MRGILLASLYFYFLIIGISAPFVLILGYVWVDIVTPQLLAYTILPSIPVSLLMALAALLMYFKLPKNEYIKFHNATLLVLVFAVWMTLTLLWAEVPDSAYAKWNWAIKGVLFTCAIPIFLRTRNHIEAFIWVIVLSGIAHCIPFGTKVILSGGGYGAQLGLIASNFGYGESSTLSMFSVTLIPMCLYLMKWQTLIPYHKLTKLMLSGFIVLCVLTAIGTYARTGLISLMVLSIMLILTSKNKFLYILIVLAGLLIADKYTGSAWSGRMSTIGDGSEGSAMGRVAVWLWTLNYISMHPMGGSFNVFLINEFVMTLADGSAMAIKGKAFHSIYFEVLGETGIPGAVIYLLIMFMTWNAFRKLKNTMFDEKYNWIGDLSYCLIICLYIYMIGGAFIGIAFQSYFFYLVALSAALLNLEKMSGVNEK